MKKFFIRTFMALCFIYVAICVALYFLQEKIIFHPEKLDHNFKFSFNQPFEELQIKTKDNSTLNGLLFKADSAKGLIFYLHGNAGSLRTWSNVAKNYTALHYDIFLLDYRGYGKSEGTISGQEQFFSDIQCANDEMKKRYDEGKIVMRGYSLGTDPATLMASTNHPRMLILQAPYYSLVDMMHKEYPFVPTFLLKYKFETEVYIKDCKMPVVIFHGDSDEMIPYSSSLELKKSFKKGDTLITLPGQGHNGMTEDSGYQKALAEILK